MARIPQKAAVRGSQRWLQQLVDQQPGLLARNLLPRLGYAPTDRIDWRSPLRRDDFAEYSDADFLSLLGAGACANTLAEFWPARGPVWDGLAAAPGGELLLVEAKAHLAELRSPACAAGVRSLSRIRASLDRAKSAFGSKSAHDWSGLFYQYANRLAHLYLLRSVSGLPAYLIFLYFVNATDMSGPASVAEFREAIDRVHDVLGLHECELSAFVLDVFIDTRDLEATTATSPA